MELMEGFPYFPVQFGKDGALLQQGELDALKNYLRSERAAGRPVTDLIVLSHGWNNNIREAHDRYASWLKCARNVLGGGHVRGLDAATFAVLGIHWPSKRYTDRDQIPGGAAGTGAWLAEFEQTLDDIAEDEDPLTASLLRRAKGLLSRLKDDPAARAEFADLVRASVAREPRDEARELEDGEDAFLDIQGAELMDLLALPADVPAPPPEDGEGGAAIVSGGATEAFGDGRAEGLQDIVKTVRDSVQGALNLTTYYGMKNRAGVVGRSGAYRALRAVSDAEPGLRLHFIGHSFGARLLTTAALAPDGGAPLPVASMTLLQAAFSHDGFGENYDRKGRDGFFRGVVSQGRVSGPIVVPHTRNDRDLGRWYAVASRLKSQQGEAVGDASDPFGALGSNGAQHTPEATVGTLTDVGGPYGFQPGKLYNLRADSVIQSHSDLAHNEVAYAFLSAIAGGVAGPAPGGATALAGHGADPAETPPSAPPQNLPAAENRDRDRLQDNLASWVIADPLMQKIHGARDRGQPDAAFDVIIDVNLLYDGGTDGADGPPPESSRERAKLRIRALMQDILARGNRAGQGVYERKSRHAHQYLFARLDADAILELVERDGQTPEGEGRRRTVGQPAVAQSALPSDRAIYHIWEDFEVKPLLSRTVRTVKANAAHAAFGAAGAGVVWAVMDSGIDCRHRHFAAYANLDVPAPLQHSDFTSLGEAPNPTPAQPPSLSAFAQADEENRRRALTDACGHGTHVAGIIAGILPVPVGRQEAAVAPEDDADPAAMGRKRPAVDDPVTSVARIRDAAGKVNYHYVEHRDTTFSGVAPQCKLLSLKVLNDRGRGNVSDVLAAINYVQEVNGYGRRLQIHGVNLSAGYAFDPEWFACGQSPLCVEVDRLVRSGVVVVVAAGNTGYGTIQSSDRGAASAGLALSINDPGNADLAITVGSTHRDMPHVYGVSYFSSKGPTGDGRVKPDLVAPGEKVLSCAAGENLRRAGANAPTGIGGNGVCCDYVEESGTSMAAPHVSGAIAAFLSVRGEYVGRPEEVKRIFTATATDLGREQSFQGSGMLDLMRALQSV